MKQPTEHVSFQFVGRNNIPSILSNLCAAGGKHRVAYKPKVISFQNPFKRPLSPFWNEFTPLNRVTNRQTSHPTCLLRRLHLRNMFVQSKRRMRCSHSFNHSLGATCVQANAVPAPNYTYYLSHTKVRNMFQSVNLQKLTQSDVPSRPCAAKRKCQFHVYNLRSSAVQTSLRKLNLNLPVNGR